MNSYNIEVYIQEVFEGNKLLYSSSSDKKHLIKDLRREQNFSGRNEEVVTRLAFEDGNVVLTLALPIPEARIGDYLAAWVIFPTNTIFSAAEKGILPRLHQQLKSLLTDPKTDYTTLGSVLDIELLEQDQPPLGFHLGSTADQTLAYRTYNEESKLAERLNNLAQPEYNNYKAVYFLPNGIHFSNSNAKLLLSPLVEYIKIDPPHLNNGISLKIKGANGITQLFNTALRMVKGQEVTLIWEQADYETIEQKQTIEEGLPIKPPTDHEWHRKLDLNNLTAQLAGRTLKYTTSINGSNPKDYYTKAEWNNGLKLTIKGPSDYKGKDLYRGDVITITSSSGVPRLYEFEEKRLAVEEAKTSGYDIYLDGEKLDRDQWKDASWWSKFHKLELKEKGVTLASDTKQLLYTELKNEVQELKKEADKQKLNSPISTDSSSEDESNEHTKELKKENDELKKDNKTLRIASGIIFFLLLISVAGNIYQGWNSIISTPPISWFCSPSPNQQDKEQLKEQYKSGKRGERSNSSDGTRTENADPLQSESPAKEEPKGGATDSTQANKPEVNKPEAPTTEASGLKKDAYKVLNQAEWSKTQLEKISPGLYDDLNRGNLKAAREKLNNCISSARAEAVEVRQAQKLFDAIGSKGLIDPDKLKSAIDSKNSSIKTNEYIKILK